MTKKEAIKYLKQIYPNGGGTWLDEQRIEAIGMAITALEEPVIEDLDEAFKQSYEREEGNILCLYDYRAGFVDCAKWQKKKMLDKACEWWSKYLVDYLQFDAQIIKDFRKAMEGE